MARILSINAPTGAPPHLWIFEAGDNNRHLKVLSAPATPLIPPVFEAYTPANAALYGIDGVENGSTGSYTFDLSDDVVNALAPSSLHGGWIRSGTGAADTGTAIIIGKVDIPQCPTLNL